MSADEIFVLTLVIGSVIAVVMMAVQSRRPKPSPSTTAAHDDKRAKELARRHEPAGERDPGGA